MTYEIVKMVSMLLLAFVSMAILLWTVLPGRKEKFIRYSRIPLDAEEIKEAQREEAASDR